MDINRLHYFCTVVQAGSLSRAAELLHISQPALSKAIKTLEHELGARLTIPSGRGIAITDEGLKLVREAQPLIEGVLALKKNLKSAKQAHVQLRIGSFEVFTTYFLARVLSGALKDTSLDVAELVPGEIEKALIERKVDIGITYLPIPAPELELLKVGAVEMRVYRRKGSFAGILFSELPFVCPNIPVEGTPSKARGLDGWPDHLYPRRIQHRVGMMEGALELCRRGFAVGYFPRFVVHAHNEQVKNAYALEEIAIPKEMKVKTSQDVFLVKRRTDLESPELRRLAAELRKLA